jgi:hypothetical protein
LNRLSCIVGPRLEKEARLAELKAPEAVQTVVQHALQVPKSRAALQQSVLVQFLGLALQHSGCGLKFNAHIELGLA